MRTARLICYILLSPAIAIKWLSFRSSIREVPGSNIGSRPALLREGLVRFLYPPGKYRSNAWNLAATAFFQILSN
jgi:hypothetical protein